MVQPDVADEHVELTVLVPVVLRDAGVAASLHEGLDPRVGATPIFGGRLLAELSRALLTPSLAKTTRILALAARSDRSNRWAISGALKPSISS
jgi:hypothetical protein